MKFTWKLNKLFSEGEKVLGVHYSLTLSDDVYSVEAEGEHIFKEETVNISYADIKEYNLLDWLNKDITESGLIKQNLINQLNSLKNPKHNKLPWLANTFTPGT
jgi:hypothetical protein